MKVYLAQFTLEEKSIYGGCKVSEVVGVFSTKGKAVTALKQAIAAKSQGFAYPLLRRDLKETDYMVDGERCIEIMYRKDFVGGHFVDCVGSIWPEEVK